MTPLQIKNSQEDTRRFVTGFTLIEILLVVIILAVLTGFAIPRFRNAYYNLQLNSFAGRMQSDINYWRDQSIVRSEAIVLNIDNDKKEYWITAASDQARLKTVAAPEGVRILAENKQVSFYPDGTIGETVIKLINSINQQISLTTRGVYGGVKIKVGE